MASQLFVDLYGCDESVIDNIDKIKEIAHQAIEEINSEIVEECSHRFLPIGVTYIAVITTSHFSIHTWPEYGYVAIDVFSCDENVPKHVCDNLKTAFGAKNMNIRQFERNIQRG